jgi:hypothetical protein
VDLAVIDEAFLCKKVPTRVGTFFHAWPTAESNASHQVEALSCRMTLLCLRVKPNSVNVISEDICFPTLVCDGAVGLAGVDLAGLRTSNKRPTESSWGLEVRCTPWHDPAVLGRLPQQRRPPGQHATSPVPAWLSGPQPLTVRLVGTTPDPG